MFLKTKTLKYMWTPMFIVCNSQDLETSPVPISGWIKSLWYICMYNYQYVAPNFLTSLQLSLLTCSFSSLYCCFSSPPLYHSLYPSVGPHLCPQIFSLSYCNPTRAPSLSFFFFFSQIWLLPFPTFSLSLLCFKISFLFSISVTFFLSTCLSLTPIFPFLFLHLWLLGILPLCFYLSFHFLPWSP